MKLLLLLAAPIWAQSQLSTPAVVHPNAAHTVGGEIRIMAPNDVDFLSIQTTVNAAIFKGKTSGNGNIGLQPGNVAGTASVFIIAPRLDQPSLITFDASGTTTGKTISLRTNGGTEFFSITGGTDASTPGQVNTRTVSPITSDTYSLGSGVGSRYLKIWGQHGDFRQSDDTAEALYAATTSATFQPAIFAESITGSGAAGKFSTRAASTGPAISATSAGSGVAIHVVNGGITDDSLVSGGVGTFLCLHSNSIGHIYTGFADCPTSPPAWNSYTPTVVNLSGVLVDAAYTQHGKDVFFRTAISGTSNGSNPTVTLPLTPQSSNITASCAASQAGAAFACLASVSGSTVTLHVYNNTAFANTLAYAFVLGGVYDTP